MQTPATLGDTQWRVPGGWVLSGAGSQEQFGLLEQIGALLAQMEEKMTNEFRTSLQAMESHLTAGPSRGRGSFKEPVTVNVAQPPVEMEVITADVDKGSVRKVIAEMERVLKDSVHHLDGRKVTNLDTLFTALDHDGDGTITQDELYNGLKGLNHDVCEADLSSLFASVGISGQQGISLDQLKRVYRAYEDTVEPEEETAPITRLNSGVTVNSAALASLKNSLRSIEDLDVDKPRRSMSDILKNSTSHQKDTALDVIMGCAILFNAVTIGISMDFEYTDGGIFAGIDIAFTCIFLIELSMKLRLLGCRGYFRSAWNRLDFILITADVSQLVLGKVIQSSLADNTPPASLFRIIRLLRLARLARVLQIGTCEDLVSMVSGMLGGMSTLTWAICLFMLLIYVISLVFREFFGGKVGETIEHRDLWIENVSEMENLKSYFASVPRSMLSVFRFSFGDFQSINGISFFETLQAVHGTVPEIFVCMLFFVITIGVFNVIAAIFIESTMAAALALQSNRKTARLNDPVLWSTRIAVLVHKLFEYNGMEFEDKKRLSQNLDTLALVPVSEAIFEQFIRDKDVIQALNELEIDGADHKFLFDILDNDNTGSIVVTQLVDGLLRLRGDPRRSDIITIDLMVRDVQEKSNMVLEGVQTSLDRLSLLVKSSIDR